MNIPSDSNGVIIMVATPILAVIALIGLWCWVKHTTYDADLLAQALKQSANLTAPLFAYQDREDWRISVGEATHPKYGRVKFQTMGIKIGSIKLQITDLLGKVLEETPLIVA